MSEEPAPASPPPLSQSTAPPAIVEELKLAGQRFMQGDFEQVKATAAERKQLESASTPVTTELAQDYAAWRKSILVMAAAVLVIAAAVNVIGFQTVESELVEGEIESAEQQGMRNINEDNVRRAVRQLWGAENLDTLGWINWLTVGTLLAVAVLTLLAARAWSTIRLSRRFARRAWYVWMFVPIGVALIPWSALLDFSHLNTQQAGELKSVAGIILGLVLTIALGPKVLSIFPGMIRSALILKTLVPETSLPAWVAAICAPIYVLVLVLVVALINQTTGNALLLFGTLCLALAPFSYLRYIRSLLRPLDRETAATRVRNARKLGYVLNALGALLIFIFFIDAEFFTFGVALEIALVAAGGLLLMMVVSSDFMLAILRVSHQQAQQLYGTEMAARLEQRLAALSAVGLTDLRTPAEATDQEQEEEKTEKKDEN